jgi:membrane protease YdiL (CAAX protease family)
MTVIDAPRTATYDHALYGTGKPWRGILAILSFLAGFLILSLIFGLAAIVIDLVLGNTSLDGMMTGEMEFTPVLMLSNNLSIAAALPLAMLLQRAFFGVKFGSLFSVTGRFRWRWFGRLAIVIVPVWAVYITLSFVLEPGGEFRFDGTAIALLVIVLLTTPFQAAGEEAGTRGLIQRSAGSWFSHPWVAFAVSTVIASTFFTIAHFAADPWLIAYYFVFAASASFSARSTGGLEAPILVHAINNVFIFVPTVLLGQLDESLDREIGAGSPVMLIPMALCIAVAVFSWWWARRYKVQTTQVVEPRMPQPPVAPPPVPGAVPVGAAGPVSVPPIPPTAPPVPPA